MAETLEIQQQVPFQVDPPSRKLWKGLYDKGKYTKTYEDFQKQFSNPESITKLHQGLQAAGEYTKGVEDFQQQFFQDSKKKHTLPSESSATVSTSPVHDKPKKLVGTVEVGNIETIPPPVEKDPIQLAQEADVLGKKGEATTAGNIDVFIPDEESVKQSNKIKEDLKKQGFDVDKLNRDFTGIPENVYAVKGFSRPELLQQYKDNPPHYERMIATAKWQSDLHDQLKGAEGGEAAWHDLMSNMEVVHVGDYDQQRQTLKRILDTIDKYGGDKRDQIIKNLGIDFTNLYGKEAGDIQALMHDERYKRGDINSNQLAATHYLEDIHPEELRKYKAAFLKEEDIKDNYEAQLGKQEAAKKLDELGIQLRKAYLNEKFNPINKEYQSLVDKSTKEGLTPEEQQRAQELEIQGKPLFDQLQMANADERDIADRYPMASYYDTKNFAQELIGQQNTGIERFLTKTGEAFKNTGAGIYDFAATPFMSKQEDEIRQAEILGSGKIDETISYLKQGDQINQTFKPELSKELQSDVDKIKKDDSLSEPEKLQATTKLLMSRMGEWQRTPHMKTNLGLKSLMYGISDMAAGLVPFMGIEIATGGGASAGLLRKLTSSFVAASATGFEDAYRSGLERGEANPYAYATRVTAITAASIAGAQTPAAIRKMFLGQKSAIGNLISKMTDKEIEAALKESPKAMKIFGKALQDAKAKSIQTVKNFGSAALSGTKDAAKINAFMSGGQIINDAVSGELKTPEEYGKHFLIETLKFALPSAAIGGVSKTLRPTDLAKSALYESATNKEGILSALEQKMKDNTITPEEGLQVKRNIEAVAKIYEKNSPFFKSLDDKAKREYLYNALTEVRAKEAAQGLPEKQAENFEMQAEIAKHKNGLIVEPKTPEQLEKRKVKLEKSLIPEKDAEGKNIEIPEKEIFAVKAEIKAIDEVLGEHKKAHESGVIVDVPQSVPKNIEIGENAQITKANEAGVTVESPQRVPEPVKLNEATTPTVSGDELNKYNGIFSKTTSTRMDYEKGERSAIGKGDGWRVELMKPDEYLALIESEIKNRLAYASKKSAEEITYNNNLNKNSREVIKNAVEKGQKLDMPFIEFGEDTHGRKGTMIDQDGRNRAAYAKEIGEPYIPVMVKGEQSESKPTTQKEEVKDAVTLLNEARDTGKLGIFKNMEDEAALKMIAEQAQNLDAKGGLGKPEDAEMAMRATVNQFGEPLVKAAIEKFKKQSVLPESEQPFVEGKNTILSHRGLQEVATEFGFDDIKSRDRKTDAKLFKDAEIAANEWMNEGKYPEKIEGLVNKAEAAEVLTDEQRVILQQRIANVRGELNSIDINSPEYDLMLKQLQRLVLAGETTRSAAGAALRVPFLGSTPNDLPSMMVEEMRITGTGELTTKQKEQVQKEFTEISESEKVYQERVTALEAENARLRAERKVGETKKNTPTTKKDFTSERKKITESISEKLKKARQDTNVVVVPYLKELIAIAPDVAKLMKSYVEEGVVKLEEIVKKIHEDLKSHIPEIKEKDVHDLIAGVYNEKKKTKNEISEQIENIRIEAKLINKLEALVRGEEPKNEKAKIKRNAAIESLRQQIKSFGKEEKTPDEIALKSLKTKMQKEMDDLREQIRTGNFEKPEPKQPIKLDAEALKLRDELIKVRQNREVRMLLAKRMNETKTQKGTRLAAEVLNIPRTLMTIGDFSGLLRQDIFFAAGHPLKTASAAKEMFKSGWSQKHYDRWLADLKEDPRYDMMQQSRLSITDSLSHDLTKREEDFMSSLSEKIPLLGKTVIKGSERSYTALLNKSRVDMFNYFADSMEERGVTFANNPKAYKAMAEYINNATGRSDFGETLNRVAPILNSVFFSPRLIASRVNMLSYWMQPRFWKTLPREVRIDYMRNWVSLLAVGGTILALAKAGGADVEEDPRSSDFGKIKSGNTRWDIWGGAQPYVRVLAQITTGKRKSTKSGKMYDLNGDDIFGETKTGVAADFFRNKLAPVPGAMIDILSGRTGVGDKVVYQWGGAKDKEISLDQYVAQRILPMTITGTYEAWKDQGVKSLLTVGVPSTFGIGTQVYGGNNQTGSSGVKKSSSSHKKNVKH